MNLSYSLLLEFYKLADSPFAKGLEGLRRILNAKN